MASKMKPDILQVADECDEGVYGLNTQPGFYLRAMALLSEDHLPVAAEYANRVKKGVTHQLLAEMREFLDKHQATPAHI